MLAQDERIGGQDVRHGGTKILGELDLPPRIARARRDGHAAEPLGAEMDAEAAREQAVAGHVLEDILATHTHHIHTAGHEVRPGVDVVLRVADGHRRARGAAGAVHAHDLALRHTQKARGILGAQVVLGGEGDARKVAEAPDGVGGDAGLV